MKSTKLIYIIYFLLIFYCTCADAQNMREPTVLQNVSNTSPIAQKELDEIRTENKILKEKIEVLNLTNDKILNSVYWTIGAILTSLFGLTVWNGIKNRSLDEEKFQLILERSKKELSDTLNEKLKKAIENKSSSDLSSTRADINNLKYKIERFKLEYMIRELKYHPFWNIQDDGSLFEDYFNFVVLDKMTSEYKYLLETIIKYLKSKPYVSLDDRNKILNFINSECSDSQYNIYNDQIKKSIENLT